MRRIIGITPAPRVGSLYNEGIWDSDAAVWRGKDVVRTTESDHTQRTSFLLGTPSLKAAGGSVVVIARCRVVMCILHCCMAMGRLQMTNIERLAAERLAGGDEVSRAAIQAVLHEHRTGCRLGKDCSPDGEETSRLFAAWPDVALLLSVGPEEPLYRAVMGMAKLLKDLYHTYQVGTRPQCRAAAAAFREHCAPRSASHYLLFLKEDADRVLDDIWPFGLAMFSNDIVESLNRFLKQAFNEHSARGGGRQALAAIKENVDTRVRVCPPRKHVHMANRAQKCTWLACRCIVPATFQTACSGDVPICHQKTLEKSFERRRNSLLERRWYTHPGYRPCRWRTSRSTLRTRAPFG